jgi:hypothetical protein
MPDNPFLPVSKALRQMMRRGDTDGIIRLLREAGSPPAAALAEQLNTAAHHYHAGLIKGETWSSAQLQLYHDIMNIMPLSADEAEGQPAPLHQSHLRSLVDSHEIRDALALCEILGDATILMQAQYEIGRKLYAEGALGLETWEITQHQIKYELWRLAEQVAGQPEEVDNVCKKIWRWWKGR